MKDFPGYEKEYYKNHGLDEEGNAPEEEKAEAKEDKKEGEEKAEKKEEEKKDESKK
jgi:hypothetical protein